MDEADLIIDDNIGMDPQVYTTQESDSESLEIEEDDRKEHPGTHEPCSYQETTALRQGTVAKQQGSQF